MSDLPQLMSEPAKPQLFQPSAILISGPLTLGQILDRAFRLYRNHFGLMLVTAAIFLVPLGVLSGWLTGNFMVGYLDMLENLSTSVDPANDPFEEVLTIMEPLAGIFGLSMGLSLLGLLFQGLVTLALVAHSLAVLQGHTLTVGASLHIGLSRLAAYLGKSIAQWFLIFIGMIGVLMIFACAGFAIFAVVGGGAAFLGGDFFGPSDGPGPIAMFGIIMTVLCLYIFALFFVFSPVLFLSGRYIAATVGLVDQRWGPIESLQKSWGLTKGRTWRSVGYVFLLSVLTLIIVNAPLIVVQNVVTAFVNDLETLGLYAGVFAGVSALFNVLWQPFYVAALVLFYMDLRVRAEGYDLDLRLQQLEGELATSVAAEPQQNQPHLTDNYGL